MKKIAVTGGLSSGKSTACRFFAELGAYVVSADEIVHALFSSDRTVRQKVVNLLSSDVLINNQLNREAIAKKVFSEPNILTSLEQIIHPAVFHEIETQYNRVKNDPRYKLFIAEIPLLYEAEQECKFDAVVVILSEEQLCKKRYTSHPNRSAEDFSHRMFRQLPPEKKAARAGFVLLNNGSLEDLKTQVQVLSLKLSK